MSKKKQKKAQAEPTPTPEPVTIGFKTYRDELVSGVFWDMLASLGPVRTPILPEPTGLGDVVAEQIGALVDGLDDFVGGEELPRPPVDMTTYADAFASAAKKCTHPNATDVLYGREWLCPDCHRYLGRDDIRRGGGLFGW